MKMTSTYRVDHDALHALFTHDMPRSAAPEVLDRVFGEICDAHTGRTFPDLVYLMHAREGLTAATDGSSYIPDALCYALWFQHIIVEPGRSDNTERSLSLARARLAELSASKKDIDDAIQLMRSRSSGTTPASYNELTLADAHTYARYGISWDRTNAIVVMEAKQEQHTNEQVVRVVAPRLARLANRPMYSSRTMRDRYDIQTRAHIHQTLANIHFLGRRAAQTV